jgi:malonyl-CoA decarboxylase
MDDGKLAGLVTQAASYGLFDRLKTLRGLWRDIAQSLGGSARIDPELPADGAALMRKQVQDCLQGRGGEVSARVRAATLGRSYLELSAVGRKNFLKILGEEFGVEQKRVDDAMAAVVAATEPVARWKAERSLREALVSPRQQLLTQFNALPEGVKFLVDMRAELLPLTKGDPAIQALEADLKELLAGWFDVGFLELQRITWRSSALVLEKIMAYEAVHTIQGWSDLKNRLDSDRRLYAFFHPRMPDEPLIFIEVALVRGIAGNVHDLLDEHAPVEDPKKADTAIFYSINNAQKGLVGISFGNFLIKRVVDSLLQEFPNLKTFSTLSPIPGFRGWLGKRLAEDDKLSLDQADLRALASLPQKVESPADFAQLLEGNWFGDAQTVQVLRSPLMRYCALYLAEKRGGSGRALDPVAHFHLSNGARLERLNWLADTSEKGIAQSAGMMINYLYKLPEIEANHEAYHGQGRIITSAAIRALNKT